MDGTIRNTLATYTPEIINGKVTGFFVHVVDITSVSPPRTSVKSKNAVLKKPLGIDDRLKNVELLLRESLFLEFPGINKLAKECFISTTKLKRDFKATFHFTPFAYYRNLQMQIADKYLEEKLLSKKQISDILGFANQSNFISCYKKYLKKSFPL
jgi:AraC-like DNA-binding protein